MPRGDENRRGIILGGNMGSDVDNGGMMVTLW